MKFKRMLAAAVCFAMIATSSATTSFVYAQEADGQITEAAAGDQTEAVSEKTEVVTEAETATEPEVSEAVVVDPVDEDVPVAVESEEEVTAEETVGEQIDKESDSFLVAPDDVTPGFSVENGVLKYTGGGVYDDAVLIELPAGTTKIPIGIFNGGSTLDNVKEVYFTKNSGSATIDDYAFNGNSKIRHVDGSHITSVGRFAFTGCATLNSFAFDTVTDIGASAFSGTGLYEAKLISAVTIGNSAFNNCSALSSVTWGPEIESIGESAFASCSFTTLTIDHLYALDPEGIGAGAFANNKRLVTATLPYQLELIPQSAFKGCDALTTINLSETAEYNIKVENHLTTVGASAFESCAKLKEIKLGKYVVEVGSLAFAGCDELSLISFYQPEGDVDIADSAIEAKPKGKKGVIKGRGGKVQDYFNKNLNGKGWTYAEVELYKITVTNPKGVTITPSIKKAGEGEEIKLTVEPGDSYTLTGIMVNGVPLEAEQGKNLLSSAPKKQVFTFNMPGSDATITGTSDTLANVFKGNKLTWTFAPGSYGATDSNLLKFPKAGGSTKIKVFNKTTNASIDLWNFTMSSSKSSIVTVSEFGEISAVKMGSALVTLKPRYSSAPTIDITADVAKSASVETISFEEYLESTYIKDATILEPNSEYNDQKYYVVEFSVDDIAKAEHKFSPKVVATDSEGDTLFINSNWTSSDTKVATVGVAKTNLNENTITIKKGTAGGQTFIKVTTINEDDGKPIEGGIIVRVLDTAPKMKQDSVQVNVAQSGGAIIQCEPVYGFSMVPGNLRVCTKSTVNGSPVYNDNNFGFTAMYQTSTSEIKLQVSNAKNKYPADSETKFSGSKTLYIVGTQKRAGEDDEVTFHMPIKEVVVINCKPKFETSYSGKINYLYTDEYYKQKYKEKYDKEISQEELDKYNNTIIYFGINNVKGVNVAKYDNRILDDVIDNYRVKFVTADNYKRSKTEVPDDDEFAANFRLVGLVKNAAGYHTGLIVKLANDIEEDDDFARDSAGNIVKSGYVKISLDGYDDSFDIPVTIPSAYTFPKYTLSTAKVTTSKYFKDPEYKVMIMDNSTSPKRCVELFEGDEDSREPKEGILMWNDYMGTDPSDFYNVPELDHSDPVKDSKGKRQYDKVTGKQLFNDYIKISAKDTPLKSKERIAFMMLGWRKPMTFDFNMAVSNSAVTGKLSPSTLTMNKQIPGQNGKMEFSFNLGDAKAVGCDDITYKYNVRTADAYEELLGAFTFVEEDVDEEGKKIPAHLIVNLESCDLDSIPKGTYSFTAYPEVNFGGYSVPASERPKVNLKLSIIDKLPKLSLKGSKFVLNTHYSGKGETASVATKVSNIAKTAQYELTESTLKDIHLVAVSPKKTPYGWYGETVDESGNWDTPDGSWKDSFEFVVCEDDNEKSTKLGVKLKAGVPDSAFNYDYYVYGLPFSVGSDDFVMNKVKITVSGHQKWETVTLSTKNVFNQIIAAKFHPDNERVVVSGYETVYTATIKNLNGKIDAVKLQEINTKTNTPYGPDYSPHFYVPEDGVDTDKKTVTILLDRENILGGDGIEPIRSGKTYTVDLKYHIKEIDGKEASDPAAVWKIKRITFTPQQVLPTIQQIGEKKIMYVGSSDNEFEFQVGKTTCQTAVMCNCADPDDDEIDTYGKTEYTKIADSASTEIRRAFKVAEVMQYQTEDGEKGDEGDEPYYLIDANNNYIRDKNKDRVPGAKISVKLVEPAILVKGKTYTVPVEIRYENQDANTKGNVVNFKVTIK